ncbi:hypothetical protein D8674_038487 [Pyrus ussuriensis x Pyrus communis]|uniref:Uncharacterized protein n=1 Tax=Pyrus ussuriensis x Pyrus communis TaxID=2448454 RepID=A0A5N5F4I0_9ROSA|nr:hypothetical protein D8674_038487 [Pyrus ussuriensis x Pyrus communis]
MDSMMLSPKKLIKYARKWEKRASMERKKIAYLKDSGNNLVKSTTSNTVTEKGTFVIYTTDERRFKSEEEFGLSSSEPITLPCDSFFMNYMLSLVNRGLTVDTEKALLNSVITRSCSINSSLHQGQTSLQLLLWGY